MQLDELVKEANRQLTICNACRYCEGYCPVFPALEMRQELGKGDVVFLAHLCHECRACYYACMYSPPHDFQINLPQALSLVRIETYRAWSWPSWLGRSFVHQHIGNILAVATTVLVMLLALLLRGPSRVFGVHLGPGAFYSVIPFFAMVIPAIALVFYAAMVWLNGGAQFWREARPAFGGERGMQALRATINDVLSLRWLKGGGPGCYYPGAKPSSLRRVYHSFVFYGFLFALISTVLAGIYQDIFHRLPPYSLASFPVIFGFIGGVAMIIGVTGLIVVKSKSDPAPATSNAPKLDYSFLAILGLASLSGLLILILRATAAMGICLTIHLGLVAALFITAPYGKFVHSMYRSLALFLYRTRHQIMAQKAEEKRQPVATGEVAPSAKSKI
ncbi:MAG TPA: tricarballylate utilization 4Fe-4S protein TcuB [Chthoniobacterales bacterium]|nr:tricarballylate utilization 4Fe-4S protein TcuB [Chthoniobacterales bacterium]